MGEVMFCAVRAIDLSVEIATFDGKVKLLDNFNVTIPQKKIFALIGPSGCGKTTFLRTIFKIYRPCQGRIELFSNVTDEKGLQIPGMDLGYMTQNYSLCDELTIAEMLNYYGLLYGMSSSECKARYVSLAKSLMLNCLKQTVGSLSGGEKRRVAFVGAVLNASKLIILDEPTVGCDPLVCEFMWQYLRKLVAQKDSTIILTTHYLEESRRADIIGFMKNGRILCEGEPNEVMHYYGAKNIEDAFATMYHEDTKSLNFSESKKDDLSAYPVQLDNQKEFNNNKINLFNYLVVFIAILVRVLRRYFKYKMFAIGSLGVTVFLVVLTALCLGSTPNHLRIGVIDHENSTFSETFLDSIDPLVVNSFKPFTSFSEALEEAKTDKIDGFLEINDNLEARLRCILYKNWDVSRLTSCRVATYYGNSVNVIVYNSLDHIFDESFKNASVSFAKTLEIDPSFTRRPVEVHGSIGKSSDPRDLYNIRNFYLPVFMIFWSSVTAMMLSSFFYQFDMDDSVYEHTRSAGGTGMQVTVANFLVCSIVPILGSWVIIPIVTRAFHGAGEESFGLIWLFYVLSSCCSIAAGLVLASIFTSSFGLIIIITGYVFSSISICGHLRPIHVIPYFVKPLRYFFPYVIIIDEVVRIGSLKLEFGETSVTICLAYSMAYLISCFVLLKLRFKLLG